MEEAEQEDGTTRVDEGENEIEDENRGMDEEQQQQQQQQQPPDESVIDDILANAINDDIYDDDDNDSPKFPSNRGQGFAMAHAASFLVLSFFFGSILAWLGLAWSVLFPSPRVPSRSQHDS